MPTGVYRGFITICSLTAAVTTAHAQSVTMGWDAADYNGDGTWEVSNFDPAISGGSSISWQGGTTETLVNSATNFTEINSYVQTPDYTLNRATGGGQSWQDILGDNPATRGDATWELVFRPGDFSGIKPIFDTGGTGSGTGLRLIGNQLNFRFQDGTTAGNFLELGTDLSAIGSASEFYHVVGVANLGAASSVSALYVNGRLVAGGGDTSLITDWDGGDDAGLGRVGGTSPQGATFDTAFGGDIAVFRQYNAQILSQPQVRSLYNSVSADATVVTVGWNAADYDGSGTWAVSEFDATQANAGNVVFTGTGTKQTGATNFGNITTWISDPGFTQGLSPTPGVGNDSFSDGSVFGSAFTQTNATIEMVFRPGDFDGKHVVYEVGGNGAGTLIQLDGSTLSFITQSQPTSVLTVSTDLASIGGEADFYHLVATIDTSDPNSLSGLYINGALIGSLGSPEVVGNWAGSDGGNIGQDTSSTAGGDTNDYTGFSGDLALLRVYGGQLFDQMHVDSAFAAVSVPEPSSAALAGAALLCLLGRRRRCDR